MLFGSGFLNGVYSQRKIDYALLAAPEITEYQSFESAQIWGKPDLGFVVQAFAQSRLKRHFSANFGIGYAIKLRVLNLQDGILGRGLFPRPFDRNGTNSRRMQLSQEINFPAILDFHFRSQQLGTFIGFGLNPSLAFFIDQKTAITNSLGQEDKSHFAGFISKAYMALQARIGRNIQLANEKVIRIDIYSNVAANPNWEAKNYQIDTGLRLGIVL